MHAYRSINHRTLLILISTALLVAVAIAWSPFARAADFTAATEAELVTAIDAANAAGAGSHTITLSADITLTAPLPAIDNSAATAITLDGAGHTLDAGGTGTALAIMPDTTAAIKNLTLTGGAGSHGSDGHSGGGLFNMGTLTVTDATLSGNTASQGAGIMNAGGEGGSSASLTLTRVTLSDNAATNAGGALANHGNDNTAAATIIDSTIIDNSAGQYGGAIANSGLVGAANLTITRSTLAGNSANLGGGLFNNGNSGQATAALTGVTLSGNEATNTGGGVFNNGNNGSATVTLTNSTLSGNTAGSSGGGLTNTANSGAALVSMRFVTLADNAAKTGGGFYNSAAAVIEASASIFAAGSQGAACAFNGGTALTSGGYNLDSDGSCGLGGAGDISDGNAGLAGLALNAPGTTATHALDAAGDAQRKVPSGTAGCGTDITTDQRGAARPNPAPACDIGAYESDAAAGGATATPTAPVPTATGTPPSPTPTTTGTPPSPTPTSPVPTATGAPPSPTPTATVPAGCAPPYMPGNEAQLNGAIACVNAAGGGTHTITLAADIELSGPTIPLGNPVAAEVILDGAGHTIDGNRKGTVLTIAGPTQARIRNITITGGQGSSGPNSNWAGGVFNTGRLTIENSSLFANIAGRGGGVFNYGDGAGASLILIRSTLSSNVATGMGGGIANAAADGGDAAVRVENTTLAGNYAVAGGGGLFNDAGGGTAGAALIYATLGTNTATSGGGGIHTLGSSNQSVVALTATIISNGLGAGPDCVAPVGSILSNGYNLDGDGTCGLNQTGDLSHANAGLLPLKVNPPGTTATLALGPGSAALNRIANGLAFCGAAIKLDQRGAARPYPAGGACDVGAYEHQSLNPLPEYVIFVPMIPKR